MRSCLAPIFARKCLDLVSVDRVELSLCSRPYRRPHVQPRKSTFFPYAQSRLACRNRSAVCKSPDREISPLQKLSSAYPFLLTLGHRSPGAYPKRDLSVGQCAWQVVLDSLIPMQGSKVSMAHLRIRKFGQLTARRWPCSEGSAPQCRKRTFAWQKRCWWGRSWHARRGLHPGGTIRGSQCCSRRESSAGFGSTEICRSFIYNSN